MADREKVIASLKACAREDVTVLCGDAGCPYWDEDNCTGKMARDAMELLKEQEPRVLTWDEVTALQNGEEDEVAVVQEQKVPVGTFDNGSICQWRGARFVQERDHYYYNEETYGTTWRCWTALPTRKQRKAVKWK